MFYRLLEMQEGDRVSITGEDGELYEYDVTHTADFPKDDFPTQEVFGLSADDELRLITCTGVFDEQNGRHLDNRVVFAEAID
ncbi:class F sortase [Nesterenkonia pannonica]|uniref:class F sortase n=1 Tax=Nesterenkonia pannonica TaxID=1548602 RepID=UPI00216470DA|nr:class F sortase [Nesterenkonia pannonica]